MSHDIDHRKIYGRGYYDGLEAAKNSEVDMSPQKMRHIENNLTTIAKKVFDAVPVQQAWSATQIKSELSRVGLTYSSKAVSGCLNSLIDSGLVKEPKSGVFIRVQKKEKPALKAVKAVSKAAPEPEEAKPVEPVSAAAKLMQLGADLRALADQLDDVVLELESEREKEQAELASVKQLKALLKDL